MPDEYYYSGRSGDSYVEATVHADLTCPDLPLDPPPRPINPDSVEQAAGVTYCPECTTVGEPDTCQVVKQDGEVCGREKPCPYHD